MDVWIRMDHVWVRGQVEANSSEDAAQIRELLAAKLGVESIGGGGLGHHSRQVPD